MHYGIYRKLPTPTTNIKKRYSEEEVAEFVEAFSDVSVMPNLTFKELYENSEWTRLVNQHEGLLKHWYFGRVVLAGDSSAQMTSAAGLGVNNGIQSGVTLVNKLHDVLSKNANPDATTLGQAFEEYQDVRREQSRAICGVAANMIRVNTWDTYKNWFLGDVVMPALISPKTMMDRAGTMIISAAPKFDFIERELNSGKIPWVK
jgi:2-polyprenyl-6-methoxyphenol hydroxylase-like FAD-dependent oxidoreductase